MSEVRNEWTDDDIERLISEQRDHCPIGESDPVGAIIFFAIVVILLASCS